MSDLLRVALCPHPPLLLRELCGRVDAVPDLRAACGAAVAELVAGHPAEVVVVGPADLSGPVEPDRPVDVRRFGTTGPRTDPATALPQSLGIGRRLLDEAGWWGPRAFHAVSWDADDEELGTLAEALLGRRGAAVLLLGDGSARRGEKAPGFLDERSFGFDDAVAAALSSGDSRPLRDLDGALAAALMVGGRSALRLLGRLGARRAPRRAELVHRDDPYGVSYFVARWDL